MNNEELVQALLSNLGQLNELLDRFERKKNDSNGFKQEELVPMAEQLLTTTPDDLFRLLAQDHPLLRQMLQKFGNLFSYLSERVTEEGSSALKKALTEKAIFIEGLSK